VERKNQIKQKRETKKKEEEETNHSDGITDIRGTAEWTQLTLYP